MAQKTKLEMLEIARPRIPRELYFRVKAAAALAKQSPDQYLTELIKAALPRKVRAV